MRPVKTWFVTREVVDLKGGDSSLPVVIKWPFHKLNPSCRDLAVIRQYISIFHPRREHRACVDIRSAEACCRKMLYFHRLKARGYA